MVVKCELCGGATAIRTGQKYHYIECGLDNIYLENIEFRVCESCGVVTPRISRILDLHTTIARAVALQPYPLSGPEVRFLRKQLGMKAREWTVRLRVDHTTLSRWENGEQKIGPQSDALIRLLYFRILEEREGRMISEPVTEKIAATSEERVPNPVVYVNMNDSNIYSYHCPQ